MTPETKTPTRADALAFTKALRSQLQADGIYGSEDVVFDRLDQIEAALATDAPIVEEEEWECFCDEAYYDQWAVRNKNGDCSFSSAIHVRTKDEAEFLVSRLNAQGRTQSAPEGWKMVPIEPTEEMLKEIFPDEDYGEPFNEIASAMREELAGQYKAMLSAAPPVTGGAWLPIESYDLAEREWAVFWCKHEKTIWHPMTGYLRYSGGDKTRPFFVIPCQAECEARTHVTHYQPLPAPQSSAEKEGV